MVPKKLCLPVILVLGTLAAAPPKSVDQKALTAFGERVKKYVALHRELEAKLPKLPKEATPQEIDKNQRALAGLIQSARQGAQRGEFFTQEMESFLRRMLKTVFSGRDGQNLLGSIMDENVEVPKLVVNERYPDTVPLSTMPAEILEALPKLDEDIEYRFVGDRLVLFDAHPHVIVDFTGSVLPKQASK